MNCTIWKHGVPWLRHEKCTTLLPIPEVTRFPRRGLVIRGFNTFSLANVKELWNKQSFDATVMLLNIVHAHCPQVIDSMATTNISSFPNQSRFIFRETPLYWNSWYDRWYGWVYHTFSKNTLGIIISSGRVILYRTPLWDSKIFRSNPIGGRVPFDYLHSGVQQSLIRGPFRIGRRLLFTNIPVRRKAVWPHN